MHLHRFEILYYVVEYGGMAAAARAIPWRIGPSAISKQMAALEKEVGGPLFKREPFELLPLGRRLFDAAAPFYVNFLAAAREAARSEGPLLRLGASEFVLLEYVVPQLAALRERQPNLRIKLEPLGRDALETALREGRIDLALVTVDTKPPKFHWQPLRQLPLVLVAPRSHPQRDAAAYWAKRPVLHPLVTPPETDAITRSFSSGLRTRKVFWPVTIEAGSAALVPATVAINNAVGVTAGARSLLRDAHVRVLPLPGFPSVIIGARWRGALTPAMSQLMELLTAVAEEVEVMTEWPVVERPKPASGQGRTGRRPA